MRRIDMRRMVFGDLTPLLDSLQNLETRYGYKVLTLDVEKEKERESRRK